MLTSKVPRHVAVIMDGNGRWAKKRHLPRVAGHKAGLESAREIVESCVKKKIEVLTLFVFSSENWQRPKDEVSYLMQLFFTILERDAKKLHEQNVQFRVIGDRARFDEKLQEQILKVESLTVHNTGLKLILAANYGGRWDITHAIQKIAQRLSKQELCLSDISEKTIQAELSLADLPDPDLFIRTSGEMRISNYLLWQLAYTELYFTDVLWPDFKADEFEKALAFYAKCERRFGLTSEQLNQKEKIC
jgi:undecaprenyl diphosphate synthase